MIGRLIGIASMALGLFALWIAPVSTVSCWKDNAVVSCYVGRAMLGIIPLESVRIPHVLHATIDHNDPEPTTHMGRGNSPTATNKTYQFAFETPAGRIAPHGLDAIDGTAGLDEIRQQINDLVESDGEPFTERTYNWFPIVAGLIFLIIGLGAAISGT